MTRAIPEIIFNVIYRPDCTHCGEIDEERMRVVLAASPWTVKTAMVSHQKAMIAMEGARRRDVTHRPVQTAWRDRLHESFEETQSKDDRLAL